MRVLSFIISQMVVCVNCENLISELNALNNMDKINLIIETEERSKVVKIGRPKGEDRERRTFDLYTRIDRRLVKQARDTGLSMTQLANEALDRYLKP